MERDNLSPTDSLIIVNDENTPSGRRAKRPLGMEDLQIRYQLSGTPREIYVANSILDLIVQTTKEAKGLNGRAFIIDRMMRVYEQTILLQNGLCRWPTLKIILEQSLGIVISNDSFRKE